MDRNTILFIVLTAIVLIGWDTLVIGPQREALRERIIASEVATRSVSVSSPRQRSGQVADRPSSAVRQASIDSTTESSGSQNLFCSPLTWR